MDVWKWEGENCILNFAPEDRVIEGFFYVQTVAEQKKTAERFRKYNVSCLFLITAFEIT